MIRTGHQELAEEVDLLEPERIGAVAVHEEGQGLLVAVPPFADVVASASEASENVTIAVQEEAEERGNTDGVYEDEDSGRHGIRLVGVGVAVDSVVGLSPHESVSRQHGQKILDYSGPMSFS
jgi:hypothetical protein